MAENKSPAPMNRVVMSLRPAVVAAALLLLCAIFMFVDATTPPIIIWDESRLAVNALEMHLRGLSLVTTYEFVPDLWNTKPPLMIWLMALSADLFGPSELAFRLPAMVSGIATLAIVFAFVRRITHTTWPAVLAVVLLATSVGFYGEHGARTGDYDALLCFFTTGYLSLLFCAVHRRRPAWRLLFGIALLVAGATMTKSVAGLVPGIGVAIYILLIRRFGRVLADPRYVVAMLLALSPIALFLAMREEAAPGYLQAFWYNDIAGRSGCALDGHDGPPWYYLRTIFLDGLFSAGPIALLAPFGLADARSRSRQALVFALYCVAGELLVVSASATKLPQYILPALPWLAIACALAVYAALPRLLGKGEREARSPVKTIAAALLFAIAILNIGIRTGIMRYSLLPQREYFAQAGYGALLSTLHDRGAIEVLLVDRGFDVEGISGYTPQLDYYTQLWRSRGMTIRRATAFPHRWPPLVASCDPMVTRALMAHGGKEVAFPGCSVLGPAVPNQPLTNRL